MSAIFSTMYTFFQDSKMAGSYLLLLALSIVVLYVVDDKHNRWLASYPIGAFILVIANPFSVWVLSLIFPVLANYQQLTVLIPILIYIPFAITELIFGLKTHRQKLIVGVILFFFVAVCGNVFGLFGGDTKIDANHYTDERKELVAYADDIAADGGLVMADDGMLPFLTAYGNNVPLLYGTDIMLFNGDLGILDEYDDGIISIHNMMWTPEENMSAIAAMAYSYGCDIIIIERFDGAKIFEGPYYVDKQTENYLIYKKKTAQ